MQALVDRRLDDGRRAEIEAYLRAHAGEAERIAAYQAQNMALHAMFDPVLEEEVPESMQHPARRR